MEWVQIYEKVPRNSRGTFISAANIPPIFVAQFVIRFAHRFFGDFSRRDESRERVRFVNNRDAVTEMRNADRTHLRVARATWGEGGRGRSEGGRLSYRAENRSRICKRSFQLTATMTRLGIAANSKSIRRVYAQKSSTNSAPNNGRCRSRFNPSRSRAVQTDVCRGL